jgi:hypothetical protein
MAHFGIMLPAQGLGWCPDLELCLHIWANSTSRPNWQAVVACMLEVVVSRATYVGEAGSEILLRQKDLEGLSEHSVRKLILVDGSLVECTKYVHQILVVLLCLRCDATYGSCSCNVRRSTVGPAKAPTKMRGR